MKAIERIVGTMAPLPRANVDTDQIIPKQFLKRIERTGFGPFLFHDWVKDPDFVLNRPEYAGASVLVTGPNFGSGSSREHAPWALEDRGFEAVIAPSFADIFRNNCLKIGLLPIELKDPDVAELTEIAEFDPSAEVVIDLDEQTVTAPNFQAHFDIDGFVKHRLRHGLDDIALTLDHSGAIDTYEAARPAFMPDLG